MRLRGDAWWAGRWTEEPFNSGQGGGSVKDEIACL